MKQKGILWIAVLILLLLIVLTSYFFLIPKSPKEVKIGYLPITASLPVFIAVEKGYFTEENLNVSLVRFETSNQLVDALVRKDIDAEAGSSSFVILTAAQNEQNLIKVFMINSFNEQNYISALIISNNSQIKSVSDLKGKKVGSYPGSTMKTYTKIYLQENDAYNDNTQIVEIAPNLQLQALSSGSVDAVLTLEPTPTIGRIKGISKNLEIAPIEKKVLNPWVAGTFSFNSEYVENNPQESKRIQKTLEKAVDFMRQNPEESKLIIMKFTSINEENIASEIPLPNTLKRNEIILTDFQKMSDLLYNEEILTKKVDVNELLY